MTAPALRHFSGGLRVAPNQRATETARERGEMKSLHVALLQALILASVVSGDDLEVPFESVGGEGLILIRGVANRAPALLLLDTGAAQTILRPELVGGGVGALPPSRFSGDGPGLRAHGRWTEATLQIGGKVWTNRSVVAMSFDEVSRAYGRRIDGLIGQDLLREFDRVTIDFRKGKVIFAGRVAAPPRGGERYDGFLSAAPRE